MGKSAEPSQHTPRGEKSPAVRVERLESVDSTSARARAMIATGVAAPERGPFAIVADRQSAGIGRFGRAWESPEGGLWMTLAWPLGSERERGMVEFLEGLGLRIGVACLRVVCGVFGTGGPDPHVRLKWPNDILVHGRKTLGVLTELVHGPPPVAAPWAVVGVGVNANVRVDAMQEPARSHATSLRRELGRPVSLDALESSLLRELAIALKATGLTREMLAEAAASLHGLDRDTTVTLPDGTRVSGVLRGLNEHGMAVMEADGRVFVPPVGSVIVSDVPLTPTA